MLKNTYQSVNSIAWISLPRTGTNYLCELLHNHPRIESHYEIFHKHKLYARNHQKIISSINKTYSTSFKTYQDPSLIKWIHKNPQKLLQVLKKLSEGHYFSFKIFPGQLNNNLVKESIIEDSSISKILIKRNLLDVYVSRGIAIKSKTWGHTDTSEIKLEINNDEFLRWFHWVSNWYQLFEENLSNIGQNFSVLSYRGIHTQKTEKDKFIYLIEFLRNVGINLELESVLTTIPNKATYKKQDNRSNIVDKITNFVEFEQQLNKHNLEYLIN